MPERCEWAGSDPLMIAYHDQEWGVPVHDDRLLFEFLTLEGAQAGLSWQTILRKREAYRQAFEGFVPEQIAGYGEAEIERLMADAGIVRNRAKIASTVGNARALLQVRKELGSFEAYLWSFVGGRPIVNRPSRSSEIPATSPESDAMSKHLKRRGFKFVGSTICYAMMQAVGMIDDHLVECHCKLRLSEYRASSK